MSETYTSWINSDHNGLYVEFPDELVEILGWEINDKVVWIDNKDGSFTVRRDNEV